MAPAHRLSTSIPEPPYDADEAGWREAVDGPRGRTSMRLDVSAGGTHGPIRRPDPYFRAGAYKRRRDVLMVLLCALTVTGLIGAIPAMHLLLAVTAFVGVVLVAYLGLLVRLRNRALEREVKLRYLPRHTEYDLPVAVRRVASR
jgi:hypothetical protein